MEVELSVIQSKVYQILHQIILEKQYGSILLAQIMQDNILTMKQRELIHKLVIATLKNQIYLDYILSCLLGLIKTSSSLPLEVIIFFWIVVYEIYFLEIKDQKKFIINNLQDMAIINKDWVPLCEKLLHTAFTNFRSEFTLHKEQKIKLKLIKYSYPFWLYKTIKGQFGSNIANCLMKDNLKLPLISFRVNTLKTTVSALLNNNDYSSYHFVPSKMVKDAIISSKTIFATKLYQTGEIIRQDQASILVSHFLHAQPYEQILDMCAGIATKTAHIAALMRNKGKIIACDIDEERLKIGASYLQKLGVTNTELIVGDAITLDFKQQFDKILLDAPSTAWGLIKRKPELKLMNLTAVELNDLIDVQRRLLKRAYELLKPQAILVYVTCTFNIKENQNQIESFLKNHPTMSIIEEKQIFGFSEKTDGVYICKLQKNG